MMYFHPGSRAVWRSEGERIHYLQEETPSLVQIIKRMKPLFGLPRCKLLVGVLIPKLAGRSIEESSTSDQFVIKKSFISPDPFKHLLSHTYTPGITLILLEKLKSPLLIQVTRWIKACKSRKINSLKVLLLTKAYGLSNQLFSDALALIFRIKNEPAQMTTFHSSFTSINSDRSDNPLIMNSDPKSIVFFIKSAKKAGQTRRDLRLEKQSKTPLLSIVGSMKFNYFANSSRDISGKDPYSVHHRLRFLAIRFKSVRGMTKIMTNQMAWRVPVQKSVASGEFVIAGRRDSHLPLLFPPPMGSAATPQPLPVAARTGGRPGVRALAAPVAAARDRPCAGRGRCASVRHGAPAGAPRRPRWPARGGRCLSG